MTQEKAQKGDLIRIIKPFEGAGDPYKVGDILKVTRRRNIPEGSDVLALFNGVEEIVADCEYEIYRKQAHQAQVGDLIRITNVRDEITAYKLGGIYEVTSLDCANYDQIAIEGEDGRSGYVFADEYVIHRKAGEEDAPKIKRDGFRELQLQMAGHTPEEAVAITMQDAVNPQHYKQGRYEVIDIIEDAVQGADPFEAVCQANILKYTLRYRAKNGVEDLRKSVWYANRLIDYLDAKSTQD